MVEVSLKTSISEITFKFAIDAMKDVGVTRSSNSGW